MARMPSYSTGKPGAVRTIGLMEARQEHYKEAIPFYRKALALNPNIPGLRLNLGLALFKNDEMKPALEQFKILLKTAPPASREAIGSRSCGLGHYGLGQFAEAVPYLKDAAQSDPRICNCASRWRTAAYGQAVPLRSGCLSRDSHVERGVRRGRYAGRRGGR